MDGWFPPPSSLPPPLKKSTKIYSYLQLSAAPSAIEIGIVSLLHPQKKHKELGEQLPEEWMAV